MLRFVVAVLLLQFTSVVSAATYQCELRARLDLMDKVETVTGEFNGDRPLELRAKGFVFKVQHVIVDGEDKLAMWLGTGDENSAVRMGNFEDKSHYLNLKLGELFAISECK